MNDMYTFLAMDALLSDSEKGRQEYGRNIRKRTFLEASKVAEGFYHLANSPTDDIRHQVAQEIAKCLAKMAEEV